MSRQLIARNPDLLRLQNEGYDIDIRGGYLLVRDVPYVNSACTVQRGILISKLELAGDKTVKPHDHVALWTGEHPCDRNGAVLSAIQNSAEAKDLGHGIKTDFRFSAKAAYRDYHHKMTTYIGRITGEASMIEPDATARTFPAIAADDADSVFKYIDTATSRAGIGMVNEKVAGQRIGIVGLGGTGAYVLDLVAKTAVAEIHLFDNDVFSQHNAFRAPGAPTLEQLQARPQKVTYLAETYSNMRNGIIVHDRYLDETTVSHLGDLDFVFLCMDAGSTKRPVVEYLNAQEIPFVDVGMGVTLDDGELGGIVRVTTSTQHTRKEANAYISFSDDSGTADEYATNIQIAELNALNASIAVINWKKHFGIYRDARKNFYSGYSIASGETVSEGLT